MNQTTIKTMKKLILSIAFIFGSNLAQSQSQLDTSDAFEGPLSQAILEAPRPKVYDGIGYLDHSSSIGALKSIFSDSGESFSRIFDNLPSEFPGATYSEESEIQVKVEDYFRKSIKGHSYDSIAYAINESEIVNDGKIVKVEREIINCFNSNQSGRARFIQISRYDGEIVHVLDNCSDLK
jgi:hypothetical protein